MTAGVASAVPAWPAAVFDAPLLRGADANGRDAIARAGKLRRVGGGERLYGDGDPSEALFIVVRGSVELHATRRGDVAASVLRVARVGDSFGEEALLPGFGRCASAVAAPGTEVAEVPAAVARRVLARQDAAGGAVGTRESRYLERAAARDVLAGSALGRDLERAELDLLLDGVVLERFARGSELVHAGDRAENVYVVAHGLLQVQRDLVVQAYLARGDFFGDDDAFAGGSYSATVVASGDTWCAVLPRAVVRTVSDRNHGVLARWRRVASAHLADQAAVVGAAAAGSTRHAFHDLYRLQVARSLLVIDQDTCVRCGHCAWSCSEVHGDSRLVRRGDKVVTPVDVVLGAARGDARGKRERGGGASSCGDTAGRSNGSAASLLLPNTCQHCRHAACLQDCPTGAIGRDLDGEVFIRADACTGCANCARACPWDNISMAPRPAPSRGPLKLSAEIAVKCDLCREYDAPACVISCPTGSILRIDPGRAFAEVAAVLGHRAAPATISATPVRDVAAASGASVRDGGASVSGVGALVARVRGVGAAMGASAAVAAAGTAWFGVWAARRSMGWVPGRGVGWLAGAIAAVIIAGLCAYVLPKRLVRRRMKPRDRRERERPAARSRTRAHLIAHIGLGVLAPALVIAHAGVAMPASPGGALWLAFALATVLGGAGAMVYRGLPRVLTRLERAGALPEDLAGDAADLRARLFREISGTDEVVKRLAARLLVPYAKAPLGWVALAASGRSLGAEERRLRARIDDILDGRGAGRLAGLDAIIRLVVELRALPGRRAMTTLLRAWLPAHIVLAAITVVLLVVHVVAVLA